MTETQREQRETPALVQAAFPSHARSVYRPRALQGYLEPDASEAVLGAPVGAFARQWLLIVALLVIGGVCAWRLAQRLSPSAPQWEAAPRG